MLVLCGYGSGPASSSPSGSSRRHIQAIGKDAKRCVDARAGSCGIREYLTVLPDQKLLIVPTEADAHVLLDVETAGLFIEQIGADGLHRMDDLGEAVVIVGRFDLQSIEIAIGLGRTRYDWEEQWGKELARANG